MGCHSGSPTWSLGNCIEGLPLKYEATLVAKWGGKVHFPPPKTNFQRFTSKLLKIIVFVEKILNVSKKMFLRVPRCYLASKIHFENKKSEITEILGSDDAIIQRESLQKSCPSGFLSTNVRTAKTQLFLTYTNPRYRLDWFWYSELITTKGMVNRKSCYCGFLWEVNSPTQTWNFDLPEQKVHISHIFRFTWAKSRDFIHFSIYLGKKYWFFTFSIYLWSRFRTLFRFTEVKSTDFPWFRFTLGPDYDYLHFFRFTSHSNFNLPLITIRATVYYQFWNYFHYRFKCQIWIYFSFQI